MLNIKRVGVIGAGTMGNGSAQVFTHAGFDVRRRPARDALPEVSQ